MRALLILLSLIAGTGPLAAQPAGESRVVIAIFGGLLGKAVRENVEAYTKPLGIQAVFVESASADILAKVRAQKSAPQYDLALLNDQTFVVAKGLDLLAKIDPVEVPNAAALRPGLMSADGYGAPYEINPVGYVYRRDKLAAAGVPVPDRGPCSYTTFYARAPVLAAKRDELAAMVRAILRTQRWVEGATPDAVAAAAAPFFPTVPPARLEAACARYQALGVWGHDPVLPRAGYDRLLAGLVSGGFVQPGTPFEQAVDNGLARAALAAVPR